MIVLLVKYRVKPGKQAEVETALQRMARLVAENEPGCRRYEVARSTEQDNLLVLYEVYEDDAAFEAHRDTAHFSEIIEDTVIPLLDSRERELYELVAP